VAILVLEGCYYKRKKVDKVRGRGEARVDVLEDESKQKRGGVSTLSRAREKGVTRAGT